ncbi:hypothetical protein [Actinoplanes flavus]|uniref:DUF4433 domain-containing protein n=1 Tax=Actinoplanes flavus TaxID=2820290 RepID=A0ABS3US40_9ACTN|nr:hypothetical protein [Actinoplanes flavus]MBO3741399.1 hypothetical protein [Actinoplanes flavus]
MGRLYHVTSVRNRDSIRRFGLDPSRMGAARGIAGSRGPEVDGIFLADEHTAGFFIRINNTGGPVDVWAADGVDPASLVISPEGFEYLPGTISPDRITLHRQDVPLP